MDGVFTGNWLYRNGTFHDWWDVGFDWSSYSVMIAVAKRSQATYCIRGNDNDKDTIYILCKKQTHIQTV